MCEVLWSSVLCIVQYSSAQYSTVHGSRSRKLHLFAWAHELTGDRLYSSVSSCALDGASSSSALNRSLEWRGAGRPQRLEARARAAHRSSGLSRHSAAGVRYPQVRLICGGIWSLLITLNLVVVSHFAECLQVRATDRDTNGEGKWTILRLLWDCRMNF